jgi:transglutaminase-like putative cysteine protease
MSGAPSYAVRHHYRYVYTEPVTNVNQRLIMVPPDEHADQVLIGFDLDVRGSVIQPTIEWFVDLFGNRVCRVHAERVDHAIDFEACFSVRREQRCDSVLLYPDHVKAYLSFTALTAPDPRIHSAALDIARASSDPMQQIELAHAWTARSIGYQIGVTGFQTPAAMALHLGEGVCQDFTHIMLSVLRALAIPARYVSGHLLGEGAPHAWVEALPMDPRTGLATVLGYDPTHQRRADHQYITVATGRDFADVTSTSGVFTGTAIGKLHWSKQAVNLTRGMHPAA